MKQSQVSQKHPSNACHTGIRCRQGNSSGKGHCPVNPGESSVGIDGDVFRSHDLIHHPDHARCSEHQAVVRPGGLPHRQCEPLSGDGSTQDCHFLCGEGTPAGGITRGHRLQIGSLRNDGAENLRMALTTRHHPGLHPLRCFSLCGGPGNVNPPDYCR